MGYEYRISWTDSKSAPDFDGFIRRQPWFESYDEELKTYHLRTTHSRGEGIRQDCSVFLESESICFCDHLSDKDGAAKIFRTLIDEVLKYADSVAICEP